ncbi:MAG: FG-GAP-like repeat-containing protein [Xanthobacteraceae bacterium]
MSRNNRIHRKELGRFSAIMTAALVMAGQIFVPGTGMAAATDPPYALVAAIAPPSGDQITSFDISFVDPTNVVAGRRKYYLANRTSKAIIVVDTVTNTVVNSFKPGFAGFSGNNDTSGPDGVLTVDEKEVWVGDFPSRVWVLDINTGSQVVPPISTGGANRADEMCYDPVDKIVAVVNNADSPPFITFISTATKTVLGKVVFDGAGGRPLATNGAEQCQWNPRTGKIYLSLPEINGPGNNSAPGGVVVFDPTTRAIVTTFIVALSACTGPQGLAVGPAPQIGLGCNVGVIGGNPAANTAIINENTGAVIAAFPGKGGGDEIWYNPGNNKYFFAARQAPGGEKLFIFDADTFAAQGVSTGTLSNAHSVAVDSISNRAYVPTSSAATSGLCSSKGVADANGCILVYAPVPLQAPLACAFNTRIADLDGDRMADLVFRRTNGDLLGFLLNGGGMKAAQGLGSIGLEWTLAGTGDFNGDGSADLLFRRGDGAVLMMLMNGFTQLGSQIVAQVGPEWSVVGVGDFNGDGRADILFRRQDGTLNVFLMNGFQLMGSQNIAFVGLEWRVAGVADFNGDGTADILLRRVSDGALTMFLMNGFAIMSASAAGTIGLEWTFVGAADFNADGRADLLFRRADGTLVMLLMNGAQLVASQSIGKVGFEMRVIGIGDIDGNGAADIVLRRTDGTLFTLQMSGFNVVSTQNLGVIGNEWENCYGESHSPVIGLN